MLAALACGQPRVDAPSVECPATASREAVTLCATAVFLELGPVDQLVGYALMKELPLVLAPRRSLDPLLLEEAGTQSILRVPLSELAQVDLATSAASDSDGNVAFSTAPGHYVLCARRLRGPVSGESFSWCMGTELVAGSPVKLLIVDNPRSGLQYIRQD